MKEKPTIGEEKKSENVSIEDPDQNLKIEQDLNQEKVLTSEPEKVHEKTAEEIDAEKIIDSFTSGNTNRAVKALKRSKFLNEMITSPEVLAAAASDIGKKVSQGNISLAIHVKRELGLPEEAAWSGVEMGLRENCWIVSNEEKMDIIVKEFNLPKDVISRIAENALTKIIRSMGGYSDKTDPLIKKFNLSREAVERSAEDGMRYCISSASIDGCEKIKDKFHLSDETTRTPEFLKAAEQGMLFAISKGNIGKVKEIQAKFRISNKIVQTPEFLKAAEKGMICAISSGDTASFEIIQNTFNFDNGIVKTAEFQKATEQGVGYQLWGGEINNATEICDLYVSTEAGVERIDESTQKDITATMGNKYNGEMYAKETLIKFVPHLGEENFFRLFPKTMDKIIGLIGENIAGNEDLADYFIENINKYLHESWAAEYALKAVEHYSVAAKFEQDWSTNSDQDWANILAVVHEKAMKIAPPHDEQNDDYYGGREDEGFRESDPYKDHEWRMTPEQIKLASALDKIMAGDYDAEEMKKMGVDVKNLESFLVEIRGEIAEAYSDFQGRAGANSKISEEDKKSFIDSERPFYPENDFKMTMLSSSVRALVARYLSQKLHYNRDNGSATLKVPINNIRNLLKEGFEKYTKVLEVDVPLYDKLYEEFDNLRETGRYPLEVYLGRDGIYAWVGRKAQDLARRRKLGLAGRKKQKEMGEVIEINPKYVVYPRYFRDKLRRDIKGQFLDQEKITPEADPLFYDTGYTGTIPEQILNIILRNAGWTKEKIAEETEKRIRLLSAPSVHRRVKGISENARSEIIEYIEHNAKTEETAEGLIIDETTGRIRHIARPTTPEEQFYYSMVKQAIARHYWIQEKLHHEPSGNVNIDSEHYSIRIRQEYMDQLPQEFIKNPALFFAHHGELLKGSKGEGQYPDEEIVLFKLNDGTEIVSKKVEIKKAKEARKEFAILIAAKKNGLPTAEPVGFLSGKEEKDGSYLLMKKVEGVSGRNFDKHLRETGKFSEAQIKDIMKQIAEKNKEMAKLFRETLKIDKHWRIKDTIIEFNEETGEVGNVIPIDWERAGNYDPDNPKEIDEIG